jgi:ATP-binding cassette subfamily B multidrug efflux pump
VLRRFENLVDPFKDYEAPTPQGTVWAFLVANLSPLRHVIVLSLVFAVIGAAIEVWLIAYAGRLVDSLEQAGARELWRERGGELTAVLILILVLRPLVAFVREGLDDISFRANSITLVRWRTHRHVLRQSVGWFRNDQAGRIATHVREVGSSATGVAYEIIHTLVFVAVYIVGSAWLMAVGDVRLVVPLLIWIAIYVGLTVYAVPRFKARSGAFQEAYSGLTGMFVDTYANIDAIKLFSQQKYDDAESRRLFERVRTTFLGVQRLEVSINVSMIALDSLLMVSLVGYAVFLWQSGSAPLGVVAAALALSFRITAMAEWLLDAISSLFNFEGSLRESLKTVAQPLSVADAPNASELKIRGGAIILRKVVYHYGKGEGGLKNVSLEIQPGEKVGLVGRSGAGKSTLVNLLLRFFELEAGAIEIDGQDIRSVTQDSLRRQIGMVAQDATLLHRSIYDNIALGRLDVAQADVEAAAEKAAAHEFIVRLADARGRTAYDVNVGDRGVKLSGGQRQRIALARAILKDAPILVLDEATSALDSEVEAAIQDTLYQIMEGKTVIAIAHRLSTIARMDRIVVLDDGQVVEEGSHQDLLNQGGVYARLWARQSGGFIGTDFYG